MLGGSCSEAQGDTLTHCSEPAYWHQHPSCSSAAQVLNSTSVFYFGDVCLQQLIHQVHTLPSFAFACIHAHTTFVFSCLHRTHLTRYNTVVLLFLCSACLLAGFTCEDVRLDRALHTFPERETVARRERERGMCSWRLIFPTRLTSNQLPAVIGGDAPRCHSPCE